MTFILNWLRFYVFAGDFHQCSQTYLKFHQDNTLSMKRTRAKLYLARRRRLYKLPTTPIGIRHHAVVCMNGECFCPTRRLCARIVHWN